MIMITTKKEKDDMMTILLDINNIKGSHDMTLIRQNLLCFLHFCTRGGGGGWGRSFDDNVDNHLALVCCFLLMQIFMFDSFQLLFDLFIF